MKNSLSPVSIIIAGALALGGSASAEEWTNLYNGKDLTGLTTKGNWEVEEDGVLTIRPREGEEGWKRYDAYLWSEKQYEDFILEVEYKHDEGGNSGVFFRVSDLADPVTNGIEVQILDSHGTDATGHHDSGGVIKTTGTTKQMAKPAGEWNHMRIEARGENIKVIYNGEKVVDVNLSETDSKDKPKKGYVGLQDHGLVMSFRNFRIQEL